MQSHMLQNMIMVRVTIHLGTIHKARYFLMDFPRDPPYDDIEIAKRNPEVSTFINSFPAAAYSITTVCPLPKKDRDMMVLHCRQRLHDIEIKFDRLQLLIEEYRTPEKISEIVADIYQESKEQKILQYLCADEQLWQEKKASGVKMDADSDLTIEVI